MQLSQSPYEQRAKSAMAIIRLKFHFGEKKLLTFLNISSYNVTNRLIK